MGSFDDVTENKRRLDKLIAENLPPHEPQTHDYTMRTWGHDYTFTPINDGMHGRMMGWGVGIETGDYLLLQNTSGSTRYRVESIEYAGGPYDMWRAVVVFAPRSGEV